MRHRELIKEVIFDTNSYEELVNSLTSKRYTKLESKECYYTF